MGFFRFIGDVLGDITGSNQAQKQADAAIAEQKLGREESTQTLRGMYMTGRQDQLPFMTPSLSALPMYQSAVLGKPVDYADPRYQALTPFDTGYVQGQTRYRAPDGSIVDQAPVLSAKYDLQQDPGFQWRNKQLDRSLRSLRRSNSTYGMQAKADFAGNEYDRGVNRLAILAGSGQGTASNIAQQGNGTAGQISGVNTSTANSLGNIYAQKGQLYTDYSPLNLAVQGAKLYATGGMG